MGHTMNDQAGSKGFPTVHIIYEMIKDSDISVRLLIVEIFVRPFVYIQKILILYFNDTELVDTPRY